MSDSPEQSAKSLKEVLQGLKESEARQLRNILSGKSNTAEDAKRYFETRIALASAFRRDGLKSPSLTDTSGWQTMLENPPAQAVWFNTVADEYQRLSENPVLSDRHAENKQIETNLRNLADTVLAPAQPEPSTTV